MPNIFDYLDWRADLPLTADPFNDVDNLILAELTYTDFSGLVDDSGECARLTDVQAGYFADRSRDEIRRSSNVLARTCLLMDGMVTGARFSDVRMSDYYNIVDDDKDMQMCAVAYHLGDGTVYIAFRGTDNTVTGWKEDFNMSYMPETEGQREAISYLNRVGRKMNCPVRVGGHSKGGNFAVYASAFCDPDVRDKIVAVYSNDGPGFRHEVMETDEYRRVLPKVKSIVPDSSVIGMLLASRTEHQVVRSSAKLLAQHDGMTWQVMRSGFVQEEQSDFSRLFGETIRDWLSKISDDLRESFVNSLFSLFESTGEDTFGEMKMQKLRTLESIVSSAQELPKAKQQELFRVIMQLVSSGGQTVRRTIEENFKEL